MWKPIRSYPVEFVATKLHTSPDGVVWAYLANGMICSYDPNRSIEIDHFDCERFAGVMFCESSCIVASYESGLFEFDYAEPRSIHSIRSSDNMMSPIVVGKNSAEIYSRVGTSFVRIDKQIELEVGFRAECAVYMGDSRVAIGGEGLGLLDFENCDVNTLRKADGRAESFVLDIDYDRRNSILATAGFGLNLYDLSGSKVAPLPDHRIRWCKFSNADELWVSCEDQNESQAAPEIRHVAIDGCKLKVVSSGAFATSERGNQTIVFVSTNAGLYEFVLDKVQ